MNTSISRFDARAILPSTSPLACYVLRLMSLKRSNLCISADVTTTAELLQLAEEVGNSICALKTHADMIDDFSERTIRCLREISRRKRFIIFEDRKFADIESSVRRQYTGGRFQIAAWAHVINAHILSGPTIITILKAAAKESLSRVTHSVNTEIGVERPRLSDAGSDVDEDVPSVTAEGAGRYQERKISIVSTTTINTYTELAFPQSHGLTNLHALEALGDQPQERGLLLLAEMSSEGNLLSDAYTKTCVEYARQDPDFVMGFIALKRPNEAMGDNFLVWTPGVSLPIEGEKATTGDEMGQRYRTPELAIKEGCDVIIVGRGILGAKRSQERSREIS